MNVANHKHLPENQAYMTLVVSQSLAQKDKAESEKDRFTRLAREFYEPVYFFIARQIGNQADAADVTQQVFLKGFQSFSRFDSSREFAPWIYTIARRCIADFFRSSKGHHEPVSEYLEDSEISPEEAADRNDGARHIWELASGLKPQMHQILLLHYKENFSLRESASIMGITNTHAKVLLFRARAAMKKRLQASPQ
jgi:RNA polymerase sigma-70 factor (ECF subfamily)